MKPQDSVNRENPDYVSDDKKPAVARTCRLKALPNPGNIMEAANGPGRLLTVVKRNVHFLTFVK